MDRNQTTKKNSPGNLGRERDAFFGRERDLELLRVLLDEGARLVTIFGPGGVGKTRLARHFAKSHASAVWFCDLSAAHEERDIALAMSRAIGAPLKKSDEAISTLGAALSEKGDAIVIVDNCEQVIAPAAKAISTWLDLAPEIRFIATSRETLHLPGERTHALDPLPLTSDAVALFVDRARQVKADWSPDDDPQLLASLIEKLEGMPLAIELAAARMRVLDTKTLSDRLSNRLSALSGGPRVAKDRHGSLRAAIDWSWQTCEEWEQRALAQTSVFVAGFSLEAAEEVIDVGVPALDVIHALADKSLLRMYEPEGFPGEIRYKMLETVREYSAERLAVAADRGATLDRHARFYLRVGTDWEAQTWHGGVESPRRLALELENLLSIHARARAEKSPDALRAAIALFPIFVTRGPFDAFVSLLDPILDEPLLANAPPELRARYLIVRGRSRQVTGRRPEAAADFSNALREARKTQDAILTARALVYVGTAERLDGRLSEARDRFEGAVRLFDEKGDARASAVVLSALGAIDLVTANLGRARLTLLRAIDTLAALGDRSARAMVQIDFGLVEQELGDFDAARTALEQALLVHTEIGNRRFMGIALGYRAGVELETKNTETARSLYEDALSTISGIGDPKLEALFKSALGVALAKMGLLEEAEAAFAAADRAAVLQGEPRIAATVTIHRGHLDIARENQALAESRRALATGLIEQSDDVRFALRLLDAALGKKKNSGDAARVSGLLIARDATWFQAPDATTRTELGKRVSSKRILMELVRRRIESPNVPISRDELGAIGGPGERLDPDAGFNRLGVALSELRRAGLRSILLHRDGGHLLDPEIPIVLE